MFRASNAQFEERDTQVLGISTNARAVQTAYSATLGNIPYPILSDFWPHGSVARTYGIFNDEMGTCRRAIIVIDKEGVIRFKRVYASAGDISIQEIVDEVDKIQG